MEIRITITDTGLTTSSLELASTGVAQPPVKSSHQTATAAPPDQIGTKAAQLGALSAGPAPSFMASSTQPGAPAPFMTGPSSAISIAAGIGHGAAESAGAAPGSSQLMKPFITAGSNSGGGQ